MNGPIVQPALPHLVRNPDRASPQFSTTSSAGPYRPPNAADLSLTPPFALFVFLSLLAALGWTFYELFGLLWPIVQ